MNDDNFSDRLRSVYTPPSQDPSRAAAFRAGVEARIERRRRRAVLVPAAAAATAAAAIAWLLLPFGAVPAVDVVADAGAPAPSATASVPPSATALVRSWEDELIFESAVSESSMSDDGEMLPDEYVAIASVFLGR